MIIELSDFFNNPSLISLGPLNIQYYAVTWVLSAYFIYLFLKSHPIPKELLNCVNERDLNLLNRRAYLRISVCLLRGTLRVSA